MKCINLLSTGITLCVPPKCGGSSVKASLMAHYGVESLADEPDVRLLSPSLVTTPVMQVVRHPVARFVSLWRNKCRDKGRLAGHQDALWGLTPRELLAYIKTHRDQHWEPQAATRRKLATKDVTLVPLYALSTWWDANTPYPALVTSNETHGDEERDDTLVDRVREYYSEDELLWYTSL